MALGLVYTYSVIPWSLTFVPIRQVPITSYHVIKPLPVYSRCRTNRVGPISASAVLAAGGSLIAAPGHSVTTRPLRQLNRLLVLKIERLGDKRAEGQEKKG